MKPVNGTLSLFNHENVSSFINFQMKAKTFSTWLENVLKANQLLLDDEQHFIPTTKWGTL